MNVQDLLKGARESLKTKKNNRLLIMVLVGILVLLIAWPTGSKTQETVANEAVVDKKDDLEMYVTWQEERLEKIVAEIDGAGKATVMITAKASKEVIIEKDENRSNSSVDENDSNGGTRLSKDSTYSEATVYNNNGSGQTSPYVVKEIEPKIEGIVVVAEGGDKLEVVNEITNTISVLFDVPIHKIKVVKMNS